MVDEDDVHRLELAWAAGIIDGEGCISIHKNLPNPKIHRVSPHYTLTIQVAMTHEETVRRMKAVFGVGSVGSYTPKNTTHKPYWMWTCSSSDAVEVIKSVQGFLVTKAVQARIGLIFTRRRNTQQGSKAVPVWITRHRDKLYNLMKSTNQGIYKGVKECV